MTPGSESPRPPPADGWLRRLRPRTAALVLAAAVVWAAVVQWVAATRPTSPPAGEVDSDGKGRDLRLYEAVVARVGAGEGYYPVLAEELPAHGFPTASVFNWRLPTYAWLLAGLGPGLTRVAAGLLAILALSVAAKAVSRELGLAAAVVFTLLQFGVLAYLLVPTSLHFTEVWVAGLFLLSAGAVGCGYRWLAVAAGLAALFLRELAGPYVVIAAVLAARGRRWKEFSAWAGGLVLFAVFLALHATQVSLHRPAGAARGPGWLEFGGLGFDLMGCRMNLLLDEVPGWLLALYFAGATVGLLAAGTEMTRLAALSAVGYMASFAVVGRAVNYYWGLLPAPFLVYGIVLLPRTVRQLVAACRQPRPRAGRGKGVVAG